MKKLLKNNKFKQSIIVFTTLFLCLLMFLNVSYWGQQVINKVDEVSAEDKDAVSFDNNFDFDSASSKGENYTSRYIYWSDFVSDISEDSITVNNGTITITSDNNYTYGHSSDDHKIIVLESAANYLEFANKCVSEESNIRQFYLDNHYVLGNNIDFSKSAQVEPIGNYNYPFTGIFDGQGFEMSNANLVEINVTSSSDGTTTSSDAYLAKYCVGYKENEPLTYYSRHSFFAYNNGTIKNLGNINPIIVQKTSFATIAENQNVESYASLLVGMNMTNGVVSNVYTIDSVDFGDDVNESTLGITLSEGAISGLVGQNEGSVNDSYVIADYLFYLNNENIVPVDIQPVVVTNNGTFKDVYYNGTRYASTSNGSSDSSYVTKDVTGVTKLTLDSDDKFTTYDYFTKATTWYQRKEESSSEYDYPKLVGIRKNNADHLSLTTAYDFILMSELINDTSTIYNTRTYSLDNDIDMSSLSKDVFTTISNSFKGTLMSYGSDNYYVYNLIINPSNTKNIAIFSELEGAEIKNISFYNTSISLTSASSDTYYVSLLTNDIKTSATFNNVQLHGNVTLSNVGSTYFGGFASKVDENTSLDISSCSVGGEFSGGSVATTSTSYVGGFIGNTDNSTSQVNISNSFNEMNIVTIGSSSISNTATVYTGGIIGYGYVNNIEKVGNKGDITSNDENYYPALTLYIGGIIGSLRGYYHDLIANTYGSFKQVTNDGNIVSYAHSSSQLIEMSGFGIVSFSSNQTDISNNLFYGITNNGTLTLTNKGSIGAVTQTLGSVGFFVTPGIIINYTSAIINGLYNNKDQEIDIPLLPTYAPNLYTNNSSTYSINLSNSYNKGNLTFSLSNEDTNLHHYYFGNTYGTNINFDCIRNEGYLFFNVNKSISKTFQNSAKQFVIAGLFLEVSDSKTAKNLYNGGNIVVNHTDTTASTVWGILYIGGICYKNNNNSVVSSTTYSSSWTSSDNIMIPSSLKGSLYNAVNNGNIFVYDTVGWGGTIRIGGIAVCSTSLISDAANLGNIEVNAKVTSITNSGFSTAGQFEIEASGIVFLLLNTESDGYGALKDCVNYGNIITYNSTTTFVWTLSSGIVGRNDKGEYGNDMNNMSTNGWANRIEYCINYGNIYSLNKSSTSNEWNQATARASGFLGCGLLSIVNSINYGNVYSSCQAGGIICYTRTDAYSSPSFIYIANIINYGEVKNVTNYTLTWNGGNSIDKTNISTYTNLANVTISSKNNGSSLANASGGIMAHFRPISSTSTTTDTTFKMFNISCLYNFSDVNLVGIVYIDSNVSLNGTDLTKKLVSGMGTTYSKDTSPSPFNSTTTNYTYNITNYTYNATATTGIFSSSFPLNNKDFDDGTVTSQYIRDYIRYVPYQNVGGYSDSGSTGLANKLSISSTKPGIYALSSSQGVATGILLPENIDLDSISPIKSDGTRDTTWCGTVSNENTIKWKISSDMLQQKKSMASTIFDGELVATDYNGNTYTLTDPIIDQDNKTITFYVASNDAGKFSGEYEFNFISYAPNAKKHEELNSSKATYDTSNTSDTYYVYCYSQAYDKDDSNFSSELYYSKYQIIVTDIDSKSMSVTSIYIDGSNASYSTSNDLTTVSTTMQNGADGNILINLNTTNIADGTELAKYVTIYRVNDSGKEIETYSFSSTSSLWTLDETNNGVVSVTTTSTDVYSSGTASIKFSATSLTRGGTYLIKISLKDTSSTYTNIEFTKNKLTSASITNMVFNNKVVATSSSTATSTIPFGTPLDVSDFTSNAEVGNTYYWYPNTFIGYRTPQTHSESVTKTYYITFEYETQMISIIPTDGTASVYSYYKLTYDNNTTSYTLSVPANTWLSAFSITSEKTSDNKYKLIFSNPFYSGSTEEANVALSYTGGDIIVNDFSDQTEVEKALTKRSLFKPNYLNSLSLSTFTNIRSITYSYSIDTSTQAKTHKFVYTLLAEDGSTTTTFTHNIQEESSLNVTYLYVDGINKDDEDTSLDSYDVSIERTSTPSILVYYDLSKYYIYDNCLTLSATYSEDGTNYEVNTSKCEAHIINNKYIVLDFNSDDPGYIKINLTYTSEDNRTVSFQEVLITKAKSSISLLQNISFSSDNSLTVQNTIVDYDELTETTYNNYYTTPSNRRINVGVRSGINYGSYNDKQNYYIAGEVSDTDVSSYKPTFTLPTGAKIYLVDSDNNLKGDGTITSDDLKSDYSNTTDSDFKFVHYRIFAEDYVENDQTYGTHYTDYYVAVVDKTYTVRFNVSVKFNSLNDQNEYYKSSKLIFITFIKYAYSDNGTTDIANLDIENYSTAMSFLQNNDVNNKTGYYDSNKEFKECSFPSNKSGIFLIKLDLLDGFTFTYKVNSSTEYNANQAFEAKALLVPRKFSVDITISKTSSTSTTWGESSSATLH